MSDDKGTAPKQEKTEDDMKETKRLVSTSQDIAIIRDIQRLDI